MHYLILNSVHEHKMASSLFSISAIYVNNEIKSEQKEVTQKSLGVISFMRLSVMFPQQNRHTRIAGMDSWDGLWGRTRS